MASVKQNGVVDRRSFEAINNNFREIKSVTRGHVQELQFFKWGVNCAD